MQQNKPSAPAVLVKPVLLHCVVEEDPKMAFENKVGSLFSDFDLKILNVFNYNEELTKLCNDFAVSKDDIEIQLIVDSSCKCQCNKIAEIEWQIGNIPSVLTVQRRNVNKEQSLHDIQKKILGQLRYNSEQDDPPARSESSKKNMRKVANSRLSAYQMVA